MLLNHQSNVFVCVLSVKKCLVGLIVLVKRSIICLITMLKSWIFWGGIFISYLDEVDWWKKTLTWWSMSLQLIHQQISWRMHDGTYLPTDSLKRKNGKYAKKLSCSFRPFDWSVPQVMSYSHHTKVVLLSFNYASSCSSIRRAV